MKKQSTCRSGEGGKEPTILTPDMSYDYSSSYCSKRGIEKKSEGCKWNENKNNKTRWGVGMPSPGEFRTWPLCTMKGKPVLFSVFRLCNSRPYARRCEASIQHHPLYGSPYNTHFISMPSRFGYTASKQLPRLPDLRTAACCC